MREKKYYISKNKFLYAVKRLRDPNGGYVYRLYVGFMKTRNWYPLIGPPDFPSLDAAEKRLAEIAKENGWAPTERHFRHGVSVRTKSNEINVPDSGTERRQNVYKNWRNACER